MAPWNKKKQQKFSGNKSNRRSKRIKKIVLFAMVSFAIGYAFYKSPIFKLLFNKTYLKLMQSNSELNSKSNTSLKQNRRRLRPLVSLAFLSAVIAIKLLNTNYQSIEVTEEKPIYNVNIHDVQVLPMIIGLGIPIVTIIFECGKIGGIACGLPVTLMIIGYGSLIKTN